MAQIAIIPDKNIINNSIGINNINKSNLTEIKLKSNSADSFNENESCDTAISNAIISRDSNSSNISNNQNNIGNINIVINNNTQLNNKNRMCVKPYSRFSNLAALS